MINCYAVQIVQPGLHPNGNMVQADLFTQCIWSTCKYSFNNYLMNTLYRKYSNKIYNLLLVLLCEFTKEISSGGLVVRAKMDCCIIATINII